MAKKDRTDRQAVIDSIRKKQSSADRLRGFAIVGVCLAIALTIVGSAAYKPVKDWYDLRTYSAAEITDIGVPLADCQEITTKAANGEQNHVDPGTPIQYEDSPPAFGQHYNVWDSIDRKLYTTTDRPDVGELVHNLEHGYTILWYDQTVADDPAMMDDLRGIASKFTDNTNYRNKFKVVPWTSDDGEPFPGDQHVAMTHWSVGGGAPAGTEEGANEAADAATGEQVGVFQYCPAPSGAALSEFMKQYPYTDSPEPDVL